MGERNSAIGLAGWAAAASMVISLHPPLSPRFAEQPWDIREPSGYRGRKTKRPNRNAKKQASAKKARKITARSRRPAAQRASKEGRKDD